MHHTTNVLFLPFHEGFFFFFFFKMQHREPLRVCVTPTRWASHEAFNCGVKWTQLPSCLFFIHASSSRNLTGRPCALCSLPTVCSGDRLMQARPETETKRAHEKKRAGQQTRAHAPDPRGAAATHFRAPAPPESLDRKDDFCCIPPTATATQHQITQTKQAHPEEEDNIIHGSLPGRKPINHGLGMMF